MLPVSNSGLKSNLTFLRAVDTTNFKGGHVPGGRTFHWQAAASCSKAPVLLKTTPMSETAATFQTPIGSESGCQCLTEWLNLDRDAPKHAPAIEVTVCRPRRAR